MQEVVYNGWKCLRLTNDETELIVTRDIGPRIIRFGFIGGPNVLGEIPADQGGRGEAEWKNRGGHRCWIAPESMPWSYELDNEPYAEAAAISGGIRTRQEPGPVTGLAKELEITLASDKNEVRVLHRYTNRGAGPVDFAPWSISVMGLNGLEIIPLPKKIPHTEMLTHNQNWSIWSYTDFADPRWKIGSRYVFLRQDPARGPTKLGVAHREGWVAYQREGCLFVKYFPFAEGAKYPDGGVNFETFTNQEILEIETLGGLVTLKPGESVEHVEKWRLFANVPECTSEDDVDRIVRPLV